MRIELEVNHRPYDPTNWERIPAAAVRQRMQVLSGMIGRRTLPGLDMPRILLKERRSSLGAKAAGSLDRTKPKQE
jgi:hypothetical protein